MARIVLISPYLKGGKNAAKLAHRTRYVAMRPGVELLADEKSELPATKRQQDFIARLLKSFPTSRELIEYEDYRERPTQGNASAFIQQTWENYAEAMDQKENFVDYISHRPGVQKSGEHGLWDADGKVQNLSQAVREVAEYTGNVWTPVIALRREDAERMGYDNAESWRALVKASVNDIAAAYKIPPEHLRWYAALHRKPKQVHIHMIVFSTDPREGYLTKEGIRQVKSAFARRIYQSDRLHIYEQKDVARESLQREARRAMAACIEELKCGAIQSPRLEQLILELAKRLGETHGRKVYGYLPPRTKAIVDASVEEIAGDEKVSAAYTAWQDLYEQVCRDYDEKPHERLPLSQQKEFKTVRNMVIQETVQWMAERQRFAENNPDRADGNTLTAIPNTDDVPNDASSGDAESDAPPQSGSELPAGWDWKDHHETAQPASVRSAAASEYYEPTVGDAVVRMLHHMSRIFEDNSKLDQVHRGLQIDRKRRRELQRKRLAMGHKVDDHEDSDLQLR